MNDYMKLSRDALRQMSDEMQWCYMKIALESTLAGKDRKLETNYGHLCYICGVKHKSKMRRIIKRLEKQGLVVVQIQYKSGTTITLKNHGYFTPAGAEAKQNGNESRRLTTTDRRGKGKPGRWVVPIDVD